MRRWRGHPFVAALRQAALAAYPDLVAELDGIAAGVGWPAEDIFLWNCRGELIHNAPDGCTTLPRATRTARAGSRTTRTAIRTCASAACSSTCSRRASRVSSALLPGSLPGHTLRRTARASRRRSTTCGSARRQRRAAHDPRARRARCDVARRGGRRAARPCAGKRLSSHAGRDRRCAAAEHRGKRRALFGDRRRAARGHANHLVHPGCDAEAQIVTQSSADRQRRVDALTPAIDAIDEAALLRVLGDRAPQGCRSTATIRPTPTTRTRWPRPCSRSARHRSISLFTNTARSVSRRASCRPDARTTRPDP